MRALCAEILSSVQEDFTPDRDCGHRWLFWRQLFSKQSGRSCPTGLSRLSVERLSQYVIARLNKVVANLSISLPFHFLKYCLIADESLGMLFRCFFPQDHSVCMYVDTLLELPNARQISNCKLVKGRCRG